MNAAEPAAAAGLAQGSGTPRRRVVVGAGLALLGSAVAWKSLRRRDEEAAPPSGVTFVGDAAPLPAFRLEGTRGEVTPAALAGRWSIVFFGYTQCADVCPTTLAALAQALRPLAPSVRPRVLFVSVDGERDTLAVLQGYVAAFDGDFLAARGADEALAPLVRHLGVRYVRNPAATGGAYTVDHTAAMFAVDPALRLQAVIAHPAEPAALGQVLKRLMQ